MAESTGATVEWDNFKRIATVTTNQKKEIFMRLLCEIGASFFVYLYAVGTWRGSWQKKS